MGRINEWIRSFFPKPVTKAYLTEYREMDGFVYCGPRIKAQSKEHAESIIDKFLLSPNGVFPLSVTGVLKGECEIDFSDITKQL